MGKSDVSRVPSLMGKQARRYQAHTAKNDDLCRRLQATDPSDPTLSLEFQTQRQTEFLLEALWLQQHASETGQKLMTLQTEIGKSYNNRDDVGSPAMAKVGMKRSMGSIRNNLQEDSKCKEI
ncbi:uncharacterized protein LOC120127532 [Hibiscus syriacus]|uniref:uncharacterized protein LOC120127532 n=1 Tax=Hibiscus syriacus TaxID=106335 RepID=UPI0019216977|nr:uncharacterized protein LOC120127532 [Hibiscus syriacus]